MEIERPRIDTANLSADGRYGKFVVEPLERGFGNAWQQPAPRAGFPACPALRHQHIKIDGVVHGFL